MLLAAAWHLSQSRDFDGTVNFIFQPAEEMGKAVGKDQDRGKATFVSLLGAAKARNQARLLAEQAARHLEQFDHKADVLRAAAIFVVERRS